MKKLLMTLAVSATTVVASAAIKSSEGFESGLGDFSGDGEAVAYDEAVTAPTSQNYPFSGANTQYCSISDTLESPEVAGATCFDMFVQFPEDASEPNLDELGTDAKVAVYLNSENKICVFYGDGNGGTTTYDEGPEVAPGTWARLTIAKGDSDYAVYINGVLIERFTPITSGDPAKKVKFTGSGKLDNYVARTTDPFVTPASVVAEIGSEKFETYADALSDALKFDKAITILDGNVVVDGTSAAPYQIPDAASLVALQEAVAAGYGANKYYVQTADIALTEAWPGIGIQNGKDIVSTAAFDNGAFTGTYDGDNHTISNFQMVDGLDYCGFFNSVKEATIKNLKISYKDGSFAKDMVAANEACGATFVGVAKASTLQNLTSLEGTVSCTKGFGGIVGYLMAGSTVDSCTNNVNLTSTAPNKCGGIAMITQNGTGKATIRNCQNNGTTAGKATEKGGIVGYVGVATTIDGCSDTAGSIPSILHNQGQSVTISGAIKAPADVVSYTTSNNKPVDGLAFASVDGDVATFVKTADLVADNTYKVMGPNAAYAFAQAGAISFDEALAAATVTAAEGLVLTTSTSGTVTTYTAAAAVAKIGDTKYTSLAAAVDGAAEGSTIILLADVALTETQTISKSVTLDLNGKNVTATDCRAFHVTAGTVAFTGTGTISTVVTQGTKLASSSSVIRVGSDTAVTSFTLGENVTVTTDYCYGITYFGTMKQTVVINGTVTVTGVQAAISGNGLAKYNTATGGSDVTVGGTVSATQDYAIYNPQTGTTAITGTVTGGIEVKAGTVTVAGTAKVTARNVTPSHSSNQNGTSTQGYAIASVGNSSYKQPAKVSVAAGATVTGTVIILKENNSETYGEITSAANTLTIPAGYVWNGPADGVYTLAVASGIDPDVGEASYDTEADAQAATVAVPEGIEVAPAVYDGYFKKTVAYNEETSKWVVTAELDATKVLPVDEEESAAETAMLEDLAAVATGSEATATVPTKAGLYYWIAGAGEVGAVNYTNGAAQLGDGTAKELAKPALTGLDGKAFYKVCVDIKDPAKQ